MKTFTCRVLAFNLLVTCCPWHESFAEGSSRQTQISNSTVRINVTQADGVYVKNPIIATNAPDAEAASANTIRMREIVDSLKGMPGIFYFPAGSYYFDGATEGHDATIETTGAFQTIQGDGPNGTRILQICRKVGATIKLRGTGCEVRDLYVGSADLTDKFRLDWEKNPHQAAIHLDAPYDPTRNPWEPPAAWSLDVKVINVNINSHGNAVLLEKYSRPFKIGIQVDGPWLNIYAHTLWITDTFTAIQITQGKVLAGPAKFIDVNYYACYARGATGTEEWTTFLKSEGTFMEQVELIHCTFLGAQFIYMDGQPTEQGALNIPVYDMVIDHCYINVLDMPDVFTKRPLNASHSGIYMNLPPYASGEGSNYGRNIRFTNNSCTGRAPEGGAFFYLQGMLRGLTFADNDISSGNAASCLMVEPQGVLNEGAVHQEPDTSIRDVKVYNNYFRNWRNIVTIGSAKAPGSKSTYVQRVNITGNQSVYEGVSRFDTETGLNISCARQVIIAQNNFQERRGDAVRIEKCEDVLVNGNEFRGLNSNAYAAVRVNMTDGFNIASNVFRSFQFGVAVQGSENGLITSNLIRDVQKGLDGIDPSKVEEYANKIIPTTK